MRYYFCFTVSSELVDLHVKLLRKVKRNVSIDRWEKVLIKLWHTYSSKDAWEIERFGYKKARLALKIKILKVCLVFSVYSARMLIKWLPFSLKQSEQVTLFLKMLAKSALSQERLSFCEGVCCFSFCYRIVFNVLYFCLFLCRNC